MSFALGLTVWRVFPYLENHARDLSTVRRMKWATVAIAFLTVAVPALPRRAILENFEFGLFDGRTAYVIGKSKDELLLYAPDEAARPRYRVRKDAPGLSLEPGGRKLFEGLTRP